MIKLLNLFLAALLAAYAFGASPTNPKTVGTVGAIVIDSSVSRGTQSQIEKVLRAQRIEAGKPVTSRQFMMAAALVNEASEGEFSAVWRRAKGSEELTLHIEKTGLR